MTARDLNITTVPTEISNLLNEVKINCPQYAEKLQEEMEYLVSFCDRSDEAAADLKAIQGILLMMVECQSCSDWDDVLAFLMRQCGRLADRLSV